jgi:hypothetical protein
MAAMLSGAAPLFVTVRRWIGLVAPTFRVPKLRLEGVRVTAGEVGAPVAPGLAIGVSVGVAVGVCVAVGVSVGAVVGVSLVVGGGS